MQPPFTDCARSIIHQAQVEARNLNKEFVGTEHLALSLLKAADCEAVRTLRANHVDHETVRSALLGMMPKSVEEPVISGDLPLSPRTQRAVNSAIVAAQAMRQSKITTPLMLALTEEESSPFNVALRNAGADIDSLRQALTQSTDESET